jgi:hypothetical protein
MNEINRFNEEIYKDLADMMKGFVKVRYKFQTSHSELSFWLLVASAFNFSNTKSKNKYPS